MLKSLILKVLTSSTAIPTDTKLDNVVIYLKRVPTHKVTSSFNHVVL